MYTVKLLAPILLSMCTQEFVTGSGDYCVVDRPAPNVIKYYEPGKACYIEGVFYESCPRRY